MAAIILVTGKPRIGKTSFVVSELMNNELYKDRKLFSNINGLKIEHHQPPEGESWDTMHKWLKYNENIGSVVAYDEAQNLFPVASNGSKLTENLLFLNVHGHSGIDMFFITQSPKIVNLNLRETANKHIHFAFNKLGKISKLEWNYVASNPLTQAKDAVSTVYKVDKNTFTNYESAKEFTKHKPVKSKFFYLFIFACVVAPFALYYSYKTLTGGSLVESEPEPTLSKTEIQTNFNNIQTSTAHTNKLTPEMFVPSISEKPESKPLYDGVRSVQAFEYPVGCVTSEMQKGCRCYSAQGTLLKEIPDNFCESYMKDGLFNPYKKESVSNSGSVLNS